MNNKIYLTLCLLASINAFSKIIKMELVDRIVAEVCSGEEKFIITLSDLSSGLEQRILKKDNNFNNDEALKARVKEVAREKSILSTAGKFSITVPDHQVEVTAGHIQAELGIDSEAKLKQLFKDIGIVNKEEWLNEVRKMLIINMFLEHKVKSKIVIDTKKAEELHNQNPTIIFVFQESFIEGADKNLVQKSIDDGSLENKIKWDKEFTTKIKKNDLGKDLPINVIEIVDESPNGITIRKVKEKTTEIEPMTEDQKKDYINQLGQELLIKEMNAFYKELDSSMKIEFKSKIKR